MVGAVYGKHFSGVIIVFVVFAALAPVSKAMAEGDGYQWSVFAYGGKWSNNRIGEIVRFNTRLRRSYVWGMGFSHNLHDITDDLEVEVELNAARHTGLQNHFELNAAVNLRWRGFPWERYINTSISYGLGPSYAFRRPPIETRSDRGPTHVLVFMPVEITFAPPSEKRPPWEALLRIHHRSGAYGIVSDARGSNFITGGLRYRF